jgi:hypothetical protein
VFRYFSLAFIIAFAVSAVTAQQFKASAFSVSNSPLLTEIKAAKAANPKMTTAELVTAANAALQKLGFSFIFTFDPATCATLEKAYAERKPGQPPPKLSATLSSVAGEKAPIIIPEPAAVAGECTKCYVTLPVLEITGTDFITIVQGQNIKFHLPANFIVNEAVLVDPKDATKVLKKWRIPFKATPAAVDYYDEVLYLNLPDPELKDIVLAVFDNGGFQFASREEADANGKAASLPDDPANSGYQLVKFTNREKTQIVKYRKACN